MLSISEIPAEAWTEFQRSSPQKSVFSSDTYLRCLGCDISYFAITKGSEKVAAFPALHKGSSIHVPPFSMDAGVHYAGLYGRKEYSRNELRHEVNDLLANELFRRFEMIVFNNHPSVVDLRAFDWLNYHNKYAAGGFDIRTRYTSYLKVSSEEFSLNYSHGRRGDFKNASKVSAIVETSEDLRELDRLHAVTFERQGIQRSVGEVEALAKIASVMLSNKLAEMYLCKIDNIGVSACLWLIGDGIAHYLFGANDPEFRRSGAGTYCMDQAIRSIHRVHGVSTFDFVGINSPNRGAFKLSFGGAIAPYFQIVKFATPGGSKMKTGSSRDLL